MTDRGQQTVWKGILGERSAGTTIGDFFFDQTPGAACPPLRPLSYASV